MMGPGRDAGSMGYDKGFTFSPEGRLHQLEYALESVKHGTLAIGIKCPEGASLVVQRRLSTPLMDPAGINKVYQIDEHVGCAIAGLHADARVLVDYARVQAQVHRLYYDEPVRLQILVKKLADVKQMYTQHGGVRPFGSALLLIGYDADGPQLFTTSPSGTYWSWKSHGIGFNESEAREFLEQEYKEDLSLFDAQVLASRALKQAVEEELTLEMLQIALVDDSRQFRIASDDEVKRVFEAL
ncbi:MAG: archaeal proteasome endopeptidase complex subunit alpha [Promethearchaeota archaeon]